MNYQSVLPFELHFEAKTALLNGQEVDSRVAHQNTYLVLGLFSDGKSAGAGAFVLEFRYI